MQQSPTTASFIGAQSHENDILSDVERLLDERPASLQTEHVVAKPARVRRLAPLALLAAIGAALALMPFGFKDALLTGRSVAHSSDR